MRSNITSFRNHFACVLIAVLATLGIAMAQEASAEWEYLVVSYGETYFYNPLLDPDAENATFSKVQLFSDIGVTIPSEAINLQRNIDVLGRFGWELVTIVGTIGGDQQLVFKRPYDEQRSVEEAARIQAEREELVAAYNESRAQASSAGERPGLLDLDAFELIQATAERNRRDEATVRGIIETAAAVGFPLHEITVSGRAYSPDSSPNVNVQVTLDVTAAALVAPGQYRKSLVDDAVEQFFASLTRSGFDKPPRYSIFCYSSDVGDGEASVVVTAVIEHDGVISEVGTYRETFCFQG